MSKMATDTLQTTALGNSARPATEKTAFAILGAISISHLLHDMIQSLVQATYPVLKAELALDFSQIGLITLVFQIAASILQPLVGLYTDHRPRPYSLVIGLGFALVGLFVLAFAGNYWAVLVAVTFIGMGSSIFHPEASRVARMASGGRLGLAQSLFQVGGNGGSAIGPLVAAFIIVPYGQKSIAWFAGAAFVAMLVLLPVARWYGQHGVKIVTRSYRAAAGIGRDITRSEITRTLAILLALIFSKAFYQAAFYSYYAFYLMDRFGLPAETAQLYLFVFMASVAGGVIVGGPIGDKIGRKAVIWVSILGALPFALAMPHVDLMWTAILSSIIGFVMASATSAIFVYGQELLPGKVGTVAGLFSGVAFGLGGLGAAVLGVLADHTSITFVYQVCAFLPLLGLLAAFLPDLRKAAA